MVLIVHGWFLASVHEDGRVHGLGMNSTVPPTWTSVGMGFGSMNRIQANRIPSSFPSLDPSSYLLRGSHFPFLPFLGVQLLPSSSLSPPHSWCNCPIVGCSCSTPTGGNPWVWFSCKFTFGGTAAIHTVERIHTTKRHLDVHLHVEMDMEGAYREMRKKQEQQKHRDVVELYEKHAERWIQGDPPQMKQPTMAYEEQTKKRVTSVATGMVALAITSAVQDENETLVQKGCRAVETLLKWLQQQEPDNREKKVSNNQPMYEVAFKYAYKATKTYLGRKDAVHDPWGWKLCQLCVECGLKLKEKEHQAILAGMELNKSIPENMRVKSYLLLMQEAMRLLPTTHIPQQTLVRIVDGMIQCSQTCALPEGCMQALRLLPTTWTPNITVHCTLPIHCATLSLRCFARMDRPSTKNTKQLIDALQFTHMHLVQIATALEDPHNVQPYQTYFEGPDPNGTSLLMRGLSLYNETFCSKPFRMILEKWECSTSKHRKNVASQALALHRTITHSAMVLCRSWVVQGSSQDVLMDRVPDAPKRHIAEAVRLVLQGMDMEPQGMEGEGGLVKKLASLELEASAPPEVNYATFFRFLMDRNGHRLLDVGTRKHLFGSLQSQAFAGSDGKKEHDSVEWLAWALRVCLSLPGPQAMERTADVVAYLSQSILIADSPMQQWQRVLMKAYEDLQDTKAAQIVMDSAVSTLIQAYDQPLMLVQKLCEDRSPDELSFSLLLAHIVRVTNLNASGSKLPERTHENAIKELCRIPRLETCGHEKVNVLMLRALPLLGTSAGTNLLAQVQQKIEDDGEASVDTALIFCCKAIFLHEESNPSFVEAALQALDACKPFLSCTCHQPRCGMQHSLCDEGSSNRDTAPRPRVDRDLLCAIGALMSIIVSSGNDMLWHHSKLLWNKSVRLYMGESDARPASVPIQRRDHFFCVNDVAQDENLTEAAQDRALKDLADPFLQLSAMQTLYDVVHTSLEKGWVAQAMKAALDAMEVLEAFMGQKKCTLLPLLDMCRFLSGRLTLSTAALLVGKVCGLSGQSKESEQFLKQSLSLSTEGKAVWLERHCKTHLAALYRRKGLFESSWEILKALKATKKLFECTVQCKSCCQWEYVHSTIVEADVFRNQGHLDQSLDQYDVAYRAASSNGFQELAILCLLNRAKCLITRMRCDDGPNLEDGIDPCAERCTRALRLVEEGLTQCSVDTGLCLIKAQLLVTACLCKIQLSSAWKAADAKDATRVRFWGDHSGFVHCLSDAEKDRLISDLLIAYHLAKEAPLIHRKICGFLSFIFGCIIGDASTSTFFLHMAVGATFRRNLNFQIQRCSSPLQNGWSCILQRFGLKHSSESNLLSTMVQDVLCGPEISGKSGAQRAAQNHLDALRKQGINHPIVTCALFSSHGVLIQESSALPLGPCNSLLVVSRVDSNSTPIVLAVRIEISNVKADGSPGAQIPINSNLESILKHSADTLSFDETDSSPGSKKLWWKKRLEVENKMESLVHRVDQEWLGVTSCIFAHVERPPDVSRIAKHVPRIPEGFLSLVVCHIPNLQKNTVIEFLRDCTSSKDIAEDAFRRMSFIVEAIGKIEYAPVAFIPDSSVQSFPWESLPSMSKFLLVRSPSVCLNLIVSSVFHVDKRQLDFCRAFYLLDPENNLPTTSKTFSHFLLEMEAKYGWAGVSRQRVPPKELHAAISEGDFFVYIGHGAPKKYLPYSTLKPLVSKAATVLMGCSSARLYHHGCFEASGYLLTLLLMGCPFVIGNLWDVTDRDIDKFSLGLFRSWLSESVDVPGNKASQSQGWSSYSKGISKCRKMCKLPYLNGAAPVCYGVPCALNMPFPHSAASG